MITTAMTTLAQLETYTSELTAAVKWLATHCPNFEAPADGNSNASQELRIILGRVNKIQALLRGPSDLLQTLAAHVRYHRTIQ